MTTDPGADERRDDRDGDGERVLQRWLRRRIDGPRAGEQPEPEPLVRIHVVPDRTAPAADTDEDELENDEDQDEDGGNAVQEPEQPAAPAPRPIPWYSIPFAKTAPDSAPPAPGPVEYAPGVHITVNQPTEPTPAPAADERAQQRRSVIRRWLAFHGSAAGVGWYLGLGPQMANLLTDSGQSAPAVGVALILVTTIFGSYLPGLTFIPPPLRPVAVWVCRIPAATAALALALHAPGTL
ncbi:hypothetical protein ACIBJC_15190 [Streptomyces sp. NPDC050509]|uniref:hypothetical protein n=1 Tax=Streptomyces sp. NPDC050509 TaxID=3365620 RepID=UPI0037A43F10